MGIIMNDREQRKGCHLGNEDGVTLVEIIIYMAVAGIVLGGAVMAFLGQSKTYNRQDVVAEIQQNIRAATNMMASEIRLALHDPASKGAKFLAATQSSLSFEYWKDEDGDGDYNDETVKTITYDLYDAYGDGGTDIGRQVGGLKRPLAEHIDRLRFEYLYWNYNTKVWSWASNAAAIQAALTLTTEAKAMEQIQAVKIIVLGSARPSVFNGTETTTFQPPLEGSAAETWTPAPNTGYKRLMSVVVQCRNSRG